MASKSNIKQIALAVTTDPTYHYAKAGPDSFDFVTDASTPARGGWTFSDAWPKTHTSSMPDDRSGDDAVDVEPGTYTVTEDAVDFW